LPLSSLPWQLCWLPEASLYSWRTINLFLCRTDTDFTQVDQGDFLGFPMPAWVTLLLFVIGSIALNLTAWGRYILAIGGNDDASRLMGLPVKRVTFPSIC
jgi:ribose/xylose/arabinose/galactoside ABC-type transport system permease subunit